MAAAPDDDEIMAVLSDAARAVNDALAGLADRQAWGLAGTRPGQYGSDLAADPAALAVIEAAGFGALSEETGLHDPDRPIVVVVDPVDGSTNASRTIPWFATSLCAVDDHGPRAALVVNQATGTRFEAVRGRGARRDGRPIAPSTATSLDRSIVGLSGMPPRYLGWRQFRALGAAALDLCLVASGGLDGYIDCSKSAHGVWDYLGGLLVCREAGAVVLEAFGRELVEMDPAARRTPLAAATPELAAEIEAARRTW